MVTTRPVSKLSGRCLRKFSNPEPPPPMPGDLPGSPWSKLYSTDKAGTYKANRTATKTKAGPYTEFVSCFRSSGSISVPVNLCNVGLEDPEVPIAMESKRPKWPRLRKAATTEAAFVLTDTITVTMASLQCSTFSRNEQMKELEPSKMAMSSSSNFSMTKSASYANLFSTSNQTHMDALDYTGLSQPRFEQEWVPTAKITTIQEMNDDDDTTTHVRDVEEETSQFKAESYMKKRKNMDKQEKKNVSMKKSNDQVPNSSEVMSVVMDKKHEGADVCPHSQRIATSSHIAPYMEIRVEEEDGDRVSRSRDHDKDDDDEVVKVTSSNVTTANDDKDDEDDCIRDEDDRRQVLRSRRTLSALSSSPRTRQERLLVQGRMTHRLRHQPASFDDSVSSSSSSSSKLPEMATRISVGVPNTAAEFRAAAKHALKARRASREEGVQRWMHRLNELVGRNDKDDQFHPSSYKVVKKDNEKEKVKANDDCRCQGLIFGRPDRPSLLV